MPKTKNKFEEFMREFGAKAQNQHTCFVLQKHNELCKEHLICGKCEKIVCEKCTCHIKNNDVCKCGHAEHAHNWGEELSYCNACICTLYTPVGAGAGKGNEREAGSNITDGMNLKDGIKRGGVSPNQSFESPENPAPTLYYGIRPAEGTCCPDCPKCDCNKCAFCQLHVKQAVSDFCKRLEKILEFDNPVGTVWLYGNDKILVQKAIKEARRE